MDCSMRAHWGLTNKCESFSLDLTWRPLGAIVILETNELGEDVRASLSALLRFVASADAVVSDLVDEAKPRKHMTETAVSARTRARQRRGLLQEGKDAFEYP